jgi:DNA-binding CsgD family transcriptional regulator
MIAAPAFGDDALAMVQLLQRERDLEQLGRAVERASWDVGGAVVIEGPAGIGKTALLRAAVARGRAVGVDVLEARGDELESDFPFGVVRQLFEARLRHASPERRVDLLDGAARLAGPAVMPERDESVRVRDARSILHGLYWLVSRLSRDAPLMLAIDDLHWADAASIRFLLYMIGRLEGVRVLVTGCVRSGEPAAAGPLLERLLASRESEYVRPGPLTEAGVAQLLTFGVGAAPDEKFVAECREVTGGTPFLIKELIAEMREQGISPTSESALRVRELGPGEVGRAARLRIERRGSAAVALATAVSVLGTDADLPRSARLAGIERDAALGAVDELVAAHVLEAGSPLTFVHPIVRSAIYNELSTADRSRVHQSAAELLAADGAPDDVIAAHLLATAPSGRVDVVGRLRAAAAAAQARGAPDSAVAYLRRALEERPGRDLRAHVLFDLGIAEKMVRDRAAADHLSEARRLFVDPAARAAAAVELGDILSFSGQWEQAYAVIDEEIAEAEHLAPTLAMRLQTSRVLGSLFDANTATEVDQRLPALRQAVRNGDASRETLLALAAVEAFRTGDAETVVGLVERGLDHGRFLAQQPGAWMLAQAFAALVHVDELDRADQMVEDMAIAAQAAGSVFTYVTVTAGRLWVGRLRGELRGLGDELRAAVAFGQEHDLASGVPVSIWFGIDALIECEGFDDLAEIELGVRLSDTLARRLTAAELADARARLLLARGEREAAISELRLCGEILTAMRAQPNVIPWRSTLALALAPDDPAAARSLVDAELEEARRIGLARSIGIALRARGLIGRGPAGVEDLRQAERTLRDSPARLEHARALVELGAARRRNNERAAARDPLREGLDLADRCGAIRLAERARTELVAAGARPSRTKLTGRDSLTPSEHRVAMMAADGMTNTQIAEALFVSAKTIENQLGRVYKKLAIASRADLRDKLEI